MLSAPTVSGATAKLGTGNVTVQSTSATITVLSIASGVANAITDTATLSLAGGGTAGVADQNYASLGAGINEVVGALILGGATKLTARMAARSAARDASAERLF